MPNDLFIWYGKGGVDNTDWQDGLNWKKSDGDQYGAARWPGSDAGLYDDVLFSGALASGASAPNGVDLSGEIELAGFRVEKDYNSAIGELGTPITLKVQHDTSPGYPDSKVIIDGMSTTLINLKGATGATYGLRRVTVLNAAGFGLILDGKIDVLHLLKGLGTFQPNINIMTKLFIGFVAAQPRDVNLTIPGDDTVSLPSEITCAGGQVTNSQAFSILNFYGGSWTHAAGDIVTLMQRGGTFYYQEGDIDYIHVHGGLFDARRPSNAGRTIKELHVYPNGRADLRNDLHNNTVAKGGFIQNWGGQIDFSVGQKFMPKP